MNMASKPDFLEWMKDKRPSRYEICLDMMIESFACEEYDDYESDMAELDAAATSEPKPIEPAVAAKPAAIQQPFYPGGGFLQQPFNPSLFPGSGYPLTAHSNGPAMSPCGLNGLAAAAMATPSEDEPKPIVVGDESAVAAETASEKIVHESF